MFGWFTPKCPVEAGMKRWIEARTGWLLGQFEKKRTLYAPMILPNEEYFPDPYDGSEEAGRMLFERTCSYMNFDPTRVELEFFQPKRKGRLDTNAISPRLGWAGLYGETNEGPETIWVDNALLDDAFGLVATYSHELAHAILLGEKRISHEEPDLEQLTDLATVVLGLGIFNANVSFRTKNYTAIGLHHSIISSIGYLAPQSFSYALALFAWLRDEDRPSWIQYLDAPVRAPCKQALAYLNKTDDATVVEGEPLDHFSASAMKSPDVESPNFALYSKEELQGFQAKIDSATPADSYFSDGYHYAEMGHWEEALEAYTLALQHNSQDAEIYQERCWVNLELGRIAEAVVDAEEAVRLNPDEPEAYLARGVASAEAWQFDRAIADLSEYLKVEDYFTRTDSGSSKAHYYRGLSFAGKNDFDKALKDYSKAIVCCPNWPNPYEARSIAYEQLGKLEEAAADREEAARRPTA
jgi:Tfp pilus assembly protein PilF